LASIVVGSVLVTAASQLAAAAPPPRCSGNRTSSSDASISKIGSSSKTGQQPWLGYQLDVSCARR